MKRRQNAGALRSHQSNTCHPLLLSEDRALVPPSFWRLTACPILQAPPLLSGFPLCAHWMCLTDPHHTHSMNTDEHRPSPRRHTYSHCHTETPETPLPATPTQGHAHITTPRWHLPFDCSRKRNSIILESLPVYPFHLPSWPTPLPPVPGSTPLGLRPHVLPDPGAEAAHY